MAPWREEDLHGHSHGVNFQSSIRHAWQAGRLRESLHLPVGHMRTEQAMLSGVLVGCLWEPKKDHSSLPAGVLEGLRRRYDMTRVPLLGSSSGAFAAALAASGVCLHGASLRGAQLFEELGIANRWEG